MPKSIITCDNCDHKGNRVLPHNPKDQTFYCKFYHTYKDPVKDSKCKHNTVRKSSKEKYFYILEPEYAGSGGCMGSDVIKEFTSLEKALKTIPKFEPEYNLPWGSVTKLKISPTPDLNNAIYFFEWDEWKWKKCR